MVDRIVQKLRGRAQELRGPESTPVDNPDALPPYEEWAAEFLPHLFSRSWSGLHKQLGKDFDRMRTVRGCRTCIVAPRGGGKSKHICVGYALYLICHGLESFILLAGSSAELPEGHLSLIKAELTENLALRVRYPQATGRGSVWNVAKIVTRNGIMVRTVGRGGRIRGAGHGRNRPTCLIGDDLDDEDSIGTPDARDKAWKWLTSTFIPLGIEAEVNVLISGTVLDPNDLTQRLRTTPGWRYRHFKTLMAEPDAIKGLWQEWERLYRDETIRKNEGELDEDAEPARDFYIANRAAMDAGAVVLWPEQESLYAIQTYRARNGERSFLSEKQGDATKTGAAEWSAELFDENVVLFNRWPHCRFRAMVCDPSKGATDKADYSAWVWGGIGPNNLIYVDANLERRDSWQICLDGCEIARGFKPHAVGMEEDSYGAIAKLWEKATEETGVLVPDLRTLRNRGDKETVRIRRLTEWLRGYRLRFRRGSAGVELLLQQLKEFPHGKYDDGPDALEMLIRLLTVLMNAAASQEQGQRDNVGDGDDFVLETVG